MNTVSQTMPVTSDNPILGNKGVGEREKLVKSRKANNHFIPTFNVENSSLLLLLIATICITNTYGYLWSGNNFLRKQISNGQLTSRFISGVTILLSLTVFSQVVAETMPATSDAMPLLGKTHALIGVHSFSVGVFSISALQKVFFLRLLLNGMIERLRKWKLLPNICNWFCAQLLVPCNFKQLLQNILSCS